MSAPTSASMLRWSKVPGRSVVIACAAMKTRRSRLRRAAKSGETRIAAAAPQVGGQAISRVMPASAQISGAARTSSSLTTLRNSAPGLCAACRLALARTRAKSFAVAPWRCMYSTPAPPK
ncbi:MAG: hypothetical protein AW08_02915 [Candidatus Accumulibacter adjunctus]|uniref:Uncharacterized protein n=1 Tax=Candidatus Accumulibacter adjunctus TaxID=1454001 RepID=A0A011NN76_9PROT|nr:MAG: hypothetical protein AW08_02915 [Candidatus Accumulibacter adjunctus]